MAKKSKTRKRPSRARQQRQQAHQGQQSWRQRMILGGVILVLVIGIGVFVRYRQQSQIAPRLQGAMDNHYTHGVAGAPVVIKEFSDYG
jgi:anti-sigma-K factor RskA